jgi:hypothetical protein
MLLSKMVGCFAPSYGGAPVTGLTNLLVEVSSLTKRMQPVTCLPHQLLADRVSPPKKLIHTISLFFLEKKHVCPFISKPLMTAPLWAKQSELARSQR